MANRKSSKLSQPTIDVNSLDETSKRELAHEAENDVAHLVETKKRNRTPQADSNVNVFIHKETDTTEIVYVKQGRSIVAVYCYIATHDLFISVAPNDEIAKSWGSEFEKVKEVARLIGNFHPSVSSNIEFIRTLATALSLNNIPKVTL